MNEREIADFLLATPAFFDRHAELLAKVQLSNPHGTRAISLQERQMEMLREKNKQLERRLAELLRYGHENDNIVNKLNRWTIRVLAERDAHALARAVSDGLREIFDVPYAALRVWDVADSYAVADFARSVSEEVRIYTNSLVTPYCGGNTGFEAAQWLRAGDDTAAGETAASGAAAAASTGPVASIALLALRDPNAGESASAFGLLVMGSPDPRRFHEGMGTDFLSRIGALSSAALSRVLAH
jgi:uncharacterized protein YigA (DUF484 family)